MTEWLAGAAFDLRTRHLPTTGVAAVRLLLRGGARCEERPGQALITGRMLAEGTHGRDWRQIAEGAEARGAIITSFASADSLGVAVDSLAADWEWALESAIELALEPAFPEDRCGWLRRQAAAELESLNDQPDVRTAWAFLDQLYRPHPLGRPPQGDPQSLAAMTGEDCRSLHRRCLAWGAVLTVAGEVDEDRVRARAGELLDRLDSRIPDPNGGPPLAPPCLGLAERRRELASGGSDQCHLYAGALTARRTDPEMPALQIAGVALGSGGALTGRIPWRVREEEGLAYAVHCDTTAGAGLDPGHLAIYVGTAPESAAAAEAAIREELARMVESGLTEGELEEARSFLIGREPFKRETAGQWAGLLAAAALYDQPVDRSEWVLDRLRSVSGQQVNDAVCRHLDPDRLRITLGRPGTADGAGG